MLLERVVYLMASSIFLPVLVRRERRAANVPNAPFP
jgi:hypothetical protein